MLRVPDKITGRKNRSGASSSVRRQGLGRRHGSWLADCNLETGRGWWHWHGEIQDLEELRLYVQLRVRLCPNVSHIYRNLKYYLIKGRLLTTAECRLLHPKLPDCLVFYAHVFNRHTVIKISRLQTAYSCLINAVTSIQTVNHNRQTREWRV